MSLFFISFIFSFFSFFMFSFFMFFIFFIFSIFHLFIFSLVAFVSFFLFFSFFFFFHFSFRHYLSFFHVSFISPLFFALHLGDFFTTQNHEVCAVPTSVDRFKLRREKDGQKEAPSFTRPARTPETKRRRKSKRTRVEGGGPSQRGFALSEPLTTSSCSIPSTRGTKQSTRCDLAWTPGKVGGPGRSHWQDTKAKLARTPEGTRASNERRCSTLKEKRVSKRRTQSAGVQVANSQFTESRMGYSSTTTSCTA